MTALFPFSEKIHLPGEAFADLGHNTEQHPLHIQKPLLQTRNSFPDKTNHIMWLRAMSFDIPFSPLGKAKNQ
jgi:hypothetical protein